MDEENRNQYRDLPSSDFDGVIKNSAAPRGRRLTRGNLRGKRVIQESRLLTNLSRGSGEPTQTGQVERSPIHHKSKTWVPSSTSRGNKKTGANSTTPAENISVGKSMPQEPVPTTSKGTRSLVSATIPPGRAREQTSSENTLGSDETAILQSVRQFECLRIARSRGRLPSERAEQMEERFMNEDYAKLLNACVTRSRRRMLESNSDNLSSEGSTCSEAVVPRNRGRTGPSSVGLQCERLLMSSKITRGRGNIAKALSSNSEEKNEGSKNALPVGFKSGSYLLRGRGRGRILEARNQESNLIRLRSVTTFRCKTCNQELKHEQTFVGEPSSSSDE